MNTGSCYQLKLVSKANKHDRSAPKCAALHEAHGANVMVRGRLVNCASRKRWNCEILDDISGQT
jgi:hypothetical protein